MLNRSLLLSGLILLCGCADPRPPTGGPRDDLPPVLVASYPPHESVGVSPTELKMTFSEYVNEGSLVRSLSIMPPPRGSLKFKWRRRSVTIRLSEKLQDSTTYVVTLNDEFRDWHGVRLTRPISFAFATGPVIDQGRLLGRVVHQNRGLPVSGLTILAYTSPNTDVVYQTQTDTDGKFAFDYVRESDFFVIGVQDQNRNLKVDHGEWFAVPPVPAIRATPDTSQQYPDWVYTRVDTLRPSIERVLAPANQQIEIRFSEKVFLSDQSGEAWFLADSLSNSPVEVYSSYQLTHRIIYLIPAPLREQTYQLLPNPAVRDSSGNVVKMDTMYFQGTAYEITESPKFQKFLPTGLGNPYQLSPWETPQVVFDRPVPESQLIRLVSVQDSAGIPVDFEFQSSNGTSYTLSYLDDPTQAYRVSVQGPDSVYVRFFQRLGPRSLGSLSGIISGKDPVVAITDAAGHILATDVPNPDGHFMLRSLPESTYHLYAFIDRNRNGRWDGGLIMPYLPAEPIGWLAEPITVRPRWDTALPDTIRINQISLENQP